MTDKRYIPCKALQVKDKFIPFWELIYVPDDEYYGEGFKIKGEFKIHYNNLQDCFYDAEEKKLLLGTIIDYFEDDSKLLFKVGDIVFAEANRMEWFEDEVEEILYTEYDIQIYSGKDESLRFYLSEEKMKDVKVNDLYEIRVWKPHYKLKHSGKVVKYDMYMKKKVSTPKNG